MQYLYSGGDADWQLVTERSSNLITGNHFAVDNGCFTGSFNFEKFKGFLERNAGHRDKCLFVVVPDKVGDCVETMRMWREYAPQLTGWPLAFVAQDGQENYELPSGFDCLFVGGTTEWKMGPGAIRCIKMAQAMGKRIHIGRVNTWRRYDHFAMLEGSEEFTCDGTKQRFIGREAALALYDSHMELARVQPRLPLSDSHRWVQPDHHDSGTGLLGSDGIRLHRPGPHGKGQAARIVEWSRTRG